MNAAMKMVKRILSMVLVCCLVVGLLPMTAMAADNDRIVTYAVTGGNILL